MHYVDVILKKREWRKAQRKHATAMEEWTERWDRRYEPSREAIEATEEEMREAYQDYARSLEALPGEPGSTWD